MMDISGWGALCFGLVVGWLTYRTVRRKQDAPALGDISAVIAAVGGTAVVGLFAGTLFGAYCVGLAIGFFGYLLTSLVLYGREGVEGFMGMGK